jgi:large subunit ribosomal protein L17
MRHGNNSTRLGVKSAHRTAMLRNMARSLVEHGRIKTTIARAKTLRPFVEKIVSRLKEPSVANLRLAVARLNDRETALKIAGDISPKFKDRNGGYLRIMRLAKPRAGDCADMALIEWVDESLVNFYQEQASAEKPAKKKVAKKKATPAKKASKPAKSAE